MRPKTRDRYKRQEHNIHVKHVTTNKRQETEDRRLDKRQEHNIHVKQVTGDRRHETEDRGQERQEKRTRRKEIRDKRTTDMTEASRHACKSDRSTTHVNMSKMTRDRI